MNTKLRSFTVIAAAFAATEFRAESFNVFNHTNFKTITTALGSGSFGSVTASHDPRVLQFGVRVRF